MRTETIFAVVSTSTAPIEITQEELDMIMKKREKDAHTAKRNAYIKEMNELLARARADGFIFTTKEAMSMSKAKPWNTTDDDWIKVE